MSFNHTGDPVETLGAERLQLYVTITCGGASPTLAETNVPGGLAVSHPATGTYRLTWPTGMLPANASLANVQCSLGNNASANSILLYNKTNLAGSLQLDLYTLTAGAAADLANGEISVCLTFKNTSK